MGTLFCKFSGNLFFPQKGGLVHQKGGRSLPLREKRGSRQMYNTGTSQPSFPLVSVGKIPEKYRPIPNRNTESRCNSKIFIPGFVLLGCLAVRFSWSDTRHHFPAVISSYLVGDNTSSKKLPATKVSTIQLALMLTLCVPTMAMSISFGEFPLKRQPKSGGA